MRNPVLGVLILTAGAVAAVGCSDQAAPQATVPATVTLSRQSTSEFQSAIMASGAAVTSAQRPVSPAVVDSLIVVVQRVEVVSDSLTAEDGAGPGAAAGRGPNAGPAVMHGAGDGAWYALAVVGDGRLNLMALPSGEGDGLTVAAGEVPPGDYDHARLYIVSAEIWFNTVVTVPPGRTFEPDEAYEVVIPSSDRTGIKTDAGFTVPETGGEIPLLFDADATVAHVNVTGS
ncbi:MAG: DUF4382 domain-containing protein, partial [Gemmatimonadales bacterium]